jgi:hypothetical protein
MSRSQDPRSQDNINHQTEYLERRDYWTKQAEDGKDFDCKEKTEDGTIRTFKYKSLKDRIGRQNCITSTAEIEANAKFPPVGGRRRFRKTKSRKSRSRKTRRR